MPLRGKPLRREVDLVAGTEQAVRASIADESAHKCTQVRLGGMDQLRLWSIRQWPNTPEPYPKINVLIIYMEDVDYLLFRG